MAKHVESRWFICVVLMFSVVFWARTTSNGLMDGASPSTSALTLYSYNGEKMYYSYIFDSGTTQNILDELDAVKTTKAKTWSLDDITLPIYGFHIVATDGSGIFVAWSNNYWISQDGTVYIFYFNFEKLVADYLTMNVGESSFSGFPRVRFLTQDENGWNTALLTPAKKLDIPDGITMTLDSWNNDVVTVTIANNRDMVWTYGVAYELQVLLDGVWYEISVTPGHWGFTSVALTIPGGAEREETYYLHMYGKLPAGTYRLVSHGISVENTIP